MADALEVKTELDHLPAQPQEGQDPLVPVDLTALVAEVYAKYDQRRTARRPYEIQWYLNASALRGFPDVRWNADANRLEARREPKHRQRKRVNFIRSKYTARTAKFTRIPPGPSVQPATTDREDIFNARATQKALEYITRKIDLPQKWQQAMGWVPITGKAYWWIRFDPLAISQTQLDGKTEPVLGDVQVDFGSAFEFLPADPGIERLGDQPEIMRVKIVEIADIENKYPAFKGQIKPETTNAEIFFYQRQIADLGSRFQGQSSRAMQEQEQEPSHCLRIELFTKPCAKYPQGRYVVCAGQQCLRNEQSLPGGFFRLTENPYPVVEFSDEAAPGQYWTDAFVERLIGLQSEYNQYRSQIAEHLILHMFPKLLIPKQANLHPDAYNNEAGEKIDYTAIQGITDSGIKFLQPQSVLGDVWNMLNLMRKEIDDVSMIYPTSIGGTGGTNSGFQTNLLQEAADQVHGPIIQRNAYALREAYLKIRHLMKQHYEIPRLVTIAGKNNIPEVFEFSMQSIDEQCDVVIDPEQLAPQMKSAKMDMVRQMFTEGVFGNPQDPKVLKRVNDMLRMGFTDFDTDQQQRDQEQAQLENIKMERAEPVQKPMPWEDHLLHWEAHTDLFKSPQCQTWPPEVWQQNVWHALVHLNYVNPQSAMMMAQEFGLNMQLMQMQMLQQPQGPFAPAPPGGPQGPPGMNPNGMGGPPGPPPPPQGEPLNNEPPPNPTAPQEQPIA
jgi:hypothetical protein